MRFSSGAIWAVALLATDAAARGSTRRNWRWTNDDQAVRTTHHPVGVATPDTAAAAKPSDVATDHHPVDHVRFNAAHPDNKNNVTSTHLPAGDVQAPAASDVPAVVIDLAPAVNDTSTAATDVTAAGAGTDDQSNALSAHNAARQEVGVTNALIWDAGLEADALEWAKHLTQEGSLVHSKGTGQGENLYMSPVGGSSPLAHASELWINEKALYGGQRVGDGDFLSYGHYTQVVWRNTQKVGMASATDSQGRIFVVARYSPAGNYQDETPY